MRTGYEKPESAITESIPTDVLLSFSGSDWDSSVSETGDSWGGEFTDDSQYGI